MHPVTLVTTQGQVAVIQSGVNPGDVVVTDGQMVLNKGSLVRVAHLAPIGSAAP
jgi:multidrug efflux pump subunit AcrA (membrane-fusion protein)